MFVKTGDEVQYTNDAILADNTKNNFSGKKLSVLNVKMAAIKKMGNLFDVFFSHAGTMYKEEGIDSSGIKLINGKLVTVFEPWSGGFSSVTNIKVPDENDRCKRCGTMGENKGLSCICPHCGEVVWGI